MSARHTAACASVLAAQLGIAACQSQETRVGTWTDSGHYLEAESAAISGGFSVSSEPAASGARILVAPSGVKSEELPGDARANYEFTVKTAASYRIWGRIRSPDAEHNRFWVQVDDGPWIKWRISVGEIWYWDAFHDDTDYGHPLEFPLAAGRHRLTLANCADNVELDRLYYTADPNDEPPGNDTPCDPPHSIELGGVCQPSCGSQGGNECGAVCQNQAPMYAYDCGPLCCHIAH
jgi:hypothetical protein